MEKISVRARNKVIENFLNSRLIKLSDRRFRASRVFVVLDNKKKQSPAAIHFVN